jgi:hypothetical protein
MYLYYAFVTTEPKKYNKLGALVPWIALKPLRMFIDLPVKPQSMMSAFAHLVHACVQKWNKKLPKIHETIWLVIGWYSFFSGGVLLFLELKKFFNCEQAVHSTKTFSISITLHEFYPTNKKNLLPQIGVWVSTYINSPKPWHFFSSQLFAAHSFSKFVWSIQGKG